MAGFYVNWDDNSFSSLKQHLSSLTELDAEWLHFSSGGLTQDDPVKAAALLAYLHTQKADGLRVVPVVNTYDGNTQSWDGASLARTLHDRAGRRKLEDGLLTYVAQVHGGGLMIDFEQVPDAAQPDFVPFMRALHARTRAMNLRLNVALPLDDDSYPYAALGAACDRVHLMAYDQHDDGGAGLAAIDASNTAGRPEAGPCGARRGQLRLRLGSGPAACQYRLVPGRADGRP